MRHEHTYLSRHTTEQLCSPRKAPHRIRYVLEAGASDVAHPAATNPTGESIEAEANESMVRTSAAGGTMLTDFQDGECFGSDL